MIELTEQERKAFSELQKGLKLETKPFKRIAAASGLSEEQVLETIKKFIDSGVIRRMGVGLKPHKMGFKENALVAFEVSSELVDAVGAELASKREVSHCYERECPPDWKYNMFAMIHSESEENLTSVINSVAEKFNLPGFKVFKTRQELKKASVRYF